MSDAKDWLESSHPAWCYNYNVDYEPQAIVIGTDKPIDDWAFMGRNYVVLGTHEKSLYDWLEDYRRWYPEQTFKYKCITVDVLDIIADRMIQKAIETVIDEFGDVK